MKTDKVEERQTPRVAGEKLNNVELRRYVALMEVMFNLDTRVYFAKRLKRAACGRVRTVPFVVPKEGLTEEEFLHEFAHVLDVTRALPKPHGVGFKDSLTRVKEVWYGTNPRTPVR
jgi:hypothetical protein